jgi:hypothetical protein
MKGAIRIPLWLQLLACAGITWAVWLKFGTFAFAFCAPLLGAVLARPIYDLVAAGYGKSREMALRDRQGRHFDFRGHAIDVVEDDDDHRWLRVRDVRKVVPGLVRDEVLQQRFGERAQALPPSRDFRIRVDALLEHLRSASEPATVKFKVWLEREVLMPSGHG